MSDKKNKPTPKRSVAQKSNVRPIVGGPKEPKKALTSEQKKELREQEKVDRLKRYDAMKRGDESALLPKDKGPVRKFIRNWIDARWNVGEFAIIVLLVGLGCSILFTAISPVIYSAVIFAVYLYLAITIIDLVVIRFQLKKALIAKFGESKDLGKGNTMYAVSRATQIRKLRSPLPQVKRGETLI